MYNYSLVPRPLPRDEATCTTCCQTKKFNESGHQPCINQYNLIMEIKLSNCTIMTLYNVLSDSKKLIEVEIQPHNGKVTAIKTTCTMYW